MRFNWLFFPMDLDGGNQCMIPTEFDLYPSSFFHVPRSLAIQEVLGCISKLAGALLFCVSGGSNTRVRHNPSHKANGSKSSPVCTQVKQISPLKCERLGLQFNAGSSAESAAPLYLGRILSCTLRHFRKEVEQFQSYPFLALAAAIVPPFDNVSPKVMAIPLKNYAEQINENLDELPCQRQGCGRVSFPEMHWPRDVVEPRTGILFPRVLDNFLLQRNNSTSTLEVLVATGFRSMRVIKVKTLKVYAFGLYIEPDSVCNKLGPKYASVPVNELNNRPDFFEDLLREDIHMTVRLVVNFNGLKINAVRDAFEKSLRARLRKVNPDTDYKCLRTFDSYFPQDITLQAGTTIDFRQTSDGQLMTEIGGKHIGAVQSKDLCKAFFDMYIGDVPVSAQAKEDIARNIAGLLRRC
ncbi:fatty-acid-binding protein 2 [Aristolochia californica]|uniref:fatty-acid-binding protein 2 n=1 Tax=Aristolochia californica TaxID=171875 RepID=UPI0035DE114A